MPFTDEQMRRLPYQETPASAFEVAEEIATLSSLAATIMASAHSVYRHEPVEAAKLAAAMIEDGAKEPGTSMVLQKMRVALALESFAGELIKNMVEMLRNTFGDPGVQTTMAEAAQESFNVMHAEAHKPPIPLGPAP